MLERSIFHYRDLGKYRVHGYVIMPDHLHAILTPGDETTLEKALMLIKGNSSRGIGIRFGGRFPVWQAGFTEHQIRNAADFEQHVRYIDNNPVEALLAERAGDYVFASAHGKFVLDSWRFASGAKAQLDAAETAGLKPRPFVHLANSGGKIRAELPVELTDSAAGSNRRSDVLAENFEGEAKPRPSFLR